MTKMPQKQQTLGLITRTIRHAHKYNSALIHFTEYDVFKKHKTPSIARMFTQVSATPAQLLLTMSVTKTPHIAECKLRCVR